MNRQLGFSLIELLVVLTLLSITLAIAIPRLESRFQQAAVSSVARDLISLGARARLNAITQRVTTSLLINNETRTFKLVHIDQNDNSEDLTPDRQYDSTIDVLIQGNNTFDRAKALHFNPDGTVAPGTVTITTTTLSKQLILRPDIGRFIIQ